MRVVLQELSLPGLDQLSADGLALFIDRRVRPLQGLAGLCDWRLCGQLSRVLETGFFQGTGGENLLMPTAGRLPVARLLVFGIGESAEGDAAEAQLARALEVAHRAGLKSLALSIDFLAADPERAAAAWGRHSRRAPLASQVLLGDWRTNGKAFRAGVAGLSEIEIAGDVPVPSQKRA
jgi:hypothetical protein